MPQQSRTQRSSNRPEASFGPYPGGISVAVWLNEVPTDSGSRKMRSITISPRRYRDAKTGEWKDAASYRPADIPGLLFGLQKALEFIYTTPIPGQEEADGEIPF